MDARLDQLLGFDADALAANRDGRLTGAQGLRLWLFGLGLGIPGLLISIAATAASLASRIALTTFISLSALLFGLYLAWRSLAYITDAALGKVSFATGSLQTNVSQGRGGKSYGMSIGPIRKDVSAATFAQLPVGAPCHAFYTPGSQSFLSAEPADQVIPSPIRPFGSDGAHASVRLRAGWLVSMVAAVGFLSGLATVAAAHPASLFQVSGQIRDYDYSVSRSSRQYNRLYLVGDSTQYTVQPYTPYVDFKKMVGRQADLYVDRWTNDVLALRIDGTLSTTYAYYHPEVMRDDTLRNGVPVTLFSGLILAIGAWRLAAGWRRRAGVAT